MRLSAFIRDREYNQNVVYVVRYGLALAIVVLNAQWIFHNGMLSAIFDQKKLQRVMNQLC